MANANKDTVTFCHPAYEANVSFWDRTRIVVAGSDAVKNQGAAFLPPLSGQDGTKYNNYKRRALFYGASGRTVQGMVGALCAKMPVLTGPGGRDSDEFFNTIVPSQTPLRSFIKHLAAEILTVGRAGLLVDSPYDGGVPILSFYRAEDIRNWRTAIVDGVESLSMLTLREEVDIPGQFATTTRVQFRVLELLVSAETGTRVYTQTVWVKADDASDDDYTPLESVVPLLRGQPMEFIPFEIINANGSATEISLPPIIELVDVNLSHYLSSADLEHARHFCALPVVWMTGFSDDDDRPPLYIGSETAWTTSNPNGKVGYLEFTGQGVAPLENALKAKEDLMIVLGARLLAPPIASSESAENQRLKRGGEDNILANVADSISESLTRAVRYLADWRVVQGFESISIELNKEYTQAEPNPQLLAQLMAMLQSGAISPSVFFYNLNKQGLIPDGTTFDDEQTEIRNGEFDTPPASATEPAADDTDAADATASA